MPEVSDAVLADCDFESERHAELRAALADVSVDGLRRLRLSMRALGADARATRAPMESLVATLKFAWAETPAPAELTEDEWHERYASSLVELLAVYFDEAG
jgi:hypothetical protein